MNSKKWFITFCIVVAAFCLLVCVFNYCTDPFGVFENDAFSWPSYEMTMNPRTAKMSYLKEHHSEYDSYIIGCSSTSSFSVDKLNKYYDANFYNMIMYGADMLDVEREAEYIINNYEVKNLFINVYLDNAISYDLKDRALTHNLPAELTGESKLAFDFKYLFSNPRYGIDKIKSKAKDTYLPQSFDVFNANTGCYDKIARDVEGINSMEEYLKAYPEFVNYPYAASHTDRNAMKGTFESIKRIKALCEENGVKFLCLTSPLNAHYIDCFDYNQVAEFYEGLADVTEYWDFALSSISYDDRYFYDATHFRNSVGDMALAKINDDDSIYIPDGFGEYISSAEDAQKRWEALATFDGIDEGAYAATLPIYVFHHISENPENSSTITPAEFESEIKKLKDEGFTTVFAEDLYNYALEGTSLPEKPCMITFDDGYESNYIYAFPILKKYNMKATIFAIGSTLGCKENYKDTSYPITPHFDAEEAKEMADSGLIQIQSHTFDMHQWAEYEEGVARENILKFKKESEADYINVLSQDAILERDLLEDATLNWVYAIAYPSGVFDTLSARILQENGYLVSFSTVRTDAVVIKGLPQSCLALPRIETSKE